MNAFSGGGNVERSQGSALRSPCSRSNGADESHHLARIRLERHTTRRARSRPKRRCRSAFHAWIAGVPPLPCLMPSSSSAVSQLSMIAEQCVGSPLVRLSVQPLFPTPGFGRRIRQEGCRGERHVFLPSEEESTLWSSGSLDHCWNQPLHQVSNRNAPPKKPHHEIERSHSATGTSGLKTGELKLLREAQDGSGPGARQSPLRFVSETSASGSRCSGQNISALYKSRPDASATSTASSFPGQAVHDREAAVLSRLDVDAFRLLGMANGQELRSRPRQKPARCQRLVLGPVDRKGARLDHWREHRINGRFRGKLHAARRRQPGKKSQPRDRHRPMTILVEHRQAAYPRSDAKPVRGDRISNQQHTRHKSRGWHRNKEQP